MHLGAKRLLSWLRKLIPSYQGKSGKGYYFSQVRWLGWGWDSCSAPGGFRFIQFGRRPVRFICYSNGSYPAFLSGKHWKILHRSKKIIAGTTTKPLRLSHLSKKGGSNETRT